MINSVFLKFYHSATLMTWANLLSKTIGLALLLPLVLSSFAESDIILWYVLTSMVGMGLLFDLGFTPTFVRFVAYANSGASIKQMGEIAKRIDIDPECSIKKNALNNVFKLLNKNYLIISLLAFFCLLVIGSFFVATPIEQSSNPLEGWLAWFVVTITTSFLLYGNKYVAILQGMKKIADNQRIMMISSVLATFTASVALFFDANLLLVIFLYQGITACSVFLNRKLVTTHFNICEPSNVNKLSSDSLRDIENLKQAVFSSAWKSAIGILMSVGLIHLSGIAAANYLPPADAVMYLLALQLVRAISSFSQAPFYTKIPQLAEYYANNNINELKKLSFNSELTSLVFFSIACLLVGISFPFIEKIFSFNATLPSNFLWFLLSLGILIERAGAMHIQIYSLTNNIIWHYVNGITGMSMIILFMLFITVQGVIAFPLALLISYSLFYFPISSYFAVKVVGRNYIIKQTGILFVCSLFLLLLIY